MARELPPPGTAVYKVRELSNSAEVQSAVFLSSRGAWCTFQNASTGEQFRENGWHWYDSKERALRSYINVMLDNQSATIRAIFGINYETYFRQIVSACAQLQALWDARKASAITTPSED